MIRIIYSCGHTEEYQGNDEVIKRRKIFVLNVRQKK